MPSTCSRRPTSPIDDVADQAGLGTAASLRAHLRTQAGVSPSDYRRTFRGLPARSSA